MSFPTTPASETRITHLKEASFLKELKNGILLKRGTAGHVEIRWNAHLSYKGREELSYQV